MLSFTRWAAAKARPGRCNKVSTSGADGGLACACDCAALLEHSKTIDPTGWKPCLLSRGIFSKEVHELKPGLVFSNDAGQRMTDPDTGKSFDFIVWALCPADNPAPRFEDCAFASRSKPPSARAGRRPISKP